MCGLVHVYCIRIISVGRGGEKRVEEEKGKIKKTDMWEREITTDCVGFKGVVVKRVAWVAFLLNL